MPLLAVLTGVAPVTPELVNQLRDELPQVTDSYLLALACAHDCKLGSFDRRLVAGAVLSGAQHLELIG